MLRAFQGPRRALDGGLGARGFAVPPAEDDVIKVDCIGCQHDIMMPEDVTTLKNFEGYAPNTAGFFRAKLNLLQT